MNESAFRHFSLILFGLILSSCSFGLKKDSCPVLYKAAFDIGSGTTKSLLSRVASCETPAISVLWEESQALALKEDLEKNSKKLGPEVFVKAKNLILAMEKRLKEKLTSLGASHDSHFEIVGGVATMALREASNGKFFASELSKETGLKISVISQDEEALLGALSARTLRPDVKTDVIWDIGGASSQWLYQHNGESKRVLSDLASVSLKLKVMKIMGIKGATPNPLGKTGVKTARKIVKDSAQTFAKDLKESVSKSNGIALGIGGVHRFSVLGQTKQKGSYSKDDVKRAIRSRYQMTDAQIGGEYAATDVTNLIFVYTLMEELGIERVEAANGNLALGVVVESLLKQKHSSP